MKDWTYDEFAHVGIDYSKKENVINYDTQMKSFRDYDEEAKTFLGKLNAPNPEELTAIDIGCGTGAFSIHAAKYFKRIYAVDVSQGMLDTVSSKARARNIDNIEYIHSGFLQFQPPEEVDIVYTKWVFHHLTEFWKQAALLNMNKMLKPGGILFLADFVFEFSSDYNAKIDDLLRGLSKDFSKEFIEEAKVHIRDEYSTFDWVIEGMLERAGFRIESSNTENKLASEYFCRKIKSF
jgi:ubiquinone/menaquinone biosynthesis C-methylase UbiE